MPWESSLAAVGKVILNNSGNFKKSFIPIAAGMDVILDFLHKAAPRFRGAKRFHIDEGIRSQSRKIFCLRAFVSLVV